MSKKKTNIDDDNSISNILNNENIVLVNNAMTTLEFVEKGQIVGDKVSLGISAENTLENELEEDLDDSSRKIKKLKNEIPTIYTNYIFYEILSRITKVEVDKLKPNNVLILNLNFGDFLKKLNKNSNNTKYIISAIRYLKSRDIFWTEKNEKGEDIEILTSIIQEIVYNTNTGYADLLISRNFARKIIDIDKKGNVSFEKKIIFNMSNISAIKIYPFLRSWANYGQYKTTLENFKEKFKFNNKGYDKWSNFKVKVIDIAIKEINEHSDIDVYYTLTGKSLESKKPKVTGIIFYIKHKPNIKYDITELEAKDNEPIEIILLEEKPKQEITNSKEGLLINIELLEKTRALINELKLKDAEIGTIRKKLDNDQIRIYELLRGYSNHIKTGIKIKSPIAYLLKSIDTLGLGIYEQEVNGLVSKKAIKNELNSKQLLEKIKRDYMNRKEEQHKILFEKLTEDEKNKLINIIKEEHTIFIPILGKEVNYYIENSVLSLSGITMAIDIYFENKVNGLLWRQDNYKNLIRERHGLEIKFTEHDEIYI